MRAESKTALSSLDLRIISNTKVDTIQLPALLLQYTKRLFGIKFYGNTDLIS